MTVVETRDSLGVRVDAAHFGDEHTVITKNGNPRAVIISYQTYRDMADKLGQLGADVGADLNKSTLNETPKRGAGTGA